MEMDFLTTQPELIDVKDFNHLLQNVDDSKELHLFRIPPQTIDPSSLKGKKIKIRKKRVEIAGKEFGLRCVTFNKDQSTLFLPHQDSPILVPAEIPLETEISFHTSFEGNQIPEISQGSSKSLKATHFKRRNFFDFNDFSTHNNSSLNNESDFSFEHQTKKKKKHKKNKSLEMNLNHSHLSKKESPIRNGEKNKSLDAVEITNGLSPSSLKSKKKRKLEDVCDSSFTLQAEKRRKNHQNESLKLNLNSSYERNYSEIAEVSTSSKRHSKNKDKTKEIQNFAKVKIKNEPPSPLTNGNETDEILNLSKVEIKDEPLSPMRKKKKKTSANEIKSYGEGQIKNEPLSCLLNFSWSDSE